MSIRDARRHAGQLAIAGFAGHSIPSDLRALAKEFRVDYALIDAEVRLELSAKKHVEAHQKYLEAVTARQKDTEVPHLFCTTWKPRD